MRPSDLPNLTFIQEHTEPGEWPDFEELGRLLRRERQPRKAGPVLALTLELTWRRFLRKQRLSRYHHQREAA